MMHDAQASDTVKAIAVLELQGECRGLAIR
jgi:hypothetical protein